MAPARMLAAAAMIRMATRAWSSVRVGRRSWAWSPRTWPTMSPAASAGNTSGGDGAAVGGDGGDGDEVEGEEDDGERVASTSSVRRCGFGFGRRRRSSRASAPVGDRAGDTTGRRAPSAPQPIIHSVGSELLSALAGGAIGAVLAGLGFVAVRLSAVPGDVARHDRRAAALDEGLERWVADDHRKLRQELNGIRNKLSREGHLYSGVIDSELAEAKTRALQRYRDRRSDPSVGWLTSSRRKVGRTSGGGGGSVCRILRCTCRSASSRSSTRGVHRQPRYRLTLAAGRPFTTRRGGRPRT